MLEEVGDDFLRVTQVAAALVWRAQDDLEGIEALDRFYRTGRLLLKPVTPCFSQPGPVFLGSDDPTFDCPPSGIDGGREGEVYCDGRQ